MKKHIKDIPEILSHNQTVYKKQLIPQNGKRTNLATFNYARLEKGMKLDPHIHIDGNEYYLILKGKGNMCIDQKWFEVGKNEYIVVPKGKIHSLVNKNKEDLHFLTLRTIDT